MLPRGCIRYLTALMCYGLNSLARKYSNGSKPVEVSLCLARNWIRAWSHRKNKKVNKRSRPYHSCTLIFPKEHAVPCTARCFPASFSFYLLWQLCYRTNLRNVDHHLEYITLDVVIGIYDKLCGIRIRYIADVIVDGGKKSETYWTLAS